MHFLKEVARRRVHSESSICSEYGRIFRANAAN